MAGGVFSSDKMTDGNVDRWGLEVTFEEVREHLGVETQRQRSTKAIAKTTPVLMALYNMVCLMGHRLNEEKTLVAERTSWYDKENIVFSDLLKAVRIALWKDNLFSRKEFSDPSVKILLQNEDLKRSLRDLLVQMLTLNSINFAKSRFKII
jgi:hypothetical protein